MGISREHADKAIPDVLPVPSTPQAEQQVADDERVYMTVSPAKLLLTMKKQEKDVAFVNNFAILPVES